MTDAKILIFIHGRRGPEPPQNWRDPLNRRLREMNYSYLDETVDKVTSVAYLDELRAGSEGPAPQDTWVKPENSPFASSEAAYVLRRADLARLVARWERDPGERISKDISSSPIIAFIADQIEPVRLYRNEPPHRHAAQRRVLEQLPRSGSAVIIAYSLGSVVAADILTKLPRDLILDLLLTIGSPLAIETLGSAKNFARAFPYDRVHAWVNVFDPRDVATIGRGIATRFPSVLDVPVDTGASHSLAAYMNHPVVAALVGCVLFGARGDEVSSELPARQVHSAWRPLLLNFAYTAQLAAVTESAKWELRIRLDAAREELARRAIDDVGRHGYDAHHRKDADGLDASPVGAGRSPSTSDLLNHAADLIRDTWSDAELVPLAVSLTMSPPLPPFDIDIKPDHRHRALSGVLNRVRRWRGDLTDEDFATPAKDAVAEVQDVLDERGFPWGKILIFGGLAVLALTGVGLAVAATAAAGLAGAAAITTTLVAFGPGGMVGGMVTLAILTGTSAALAGAGVSLEVALGGKRFEALRLQAAEGIAKSSLSELRTTVAGMLAVVSEEHNLHAYIAPGTRSTEEWKSKADVLRRALGWVGAHTDDDAKRNEFQKLLEA